VPLVNMISVSLPSKDVAVGQGLNSTLKSVGAAFGPVIATAVMTTFTDPVTKVVNGSPKVVAVVPSATAFNVIFIIGIALTALMAVVSLATKNYKYPKK